MKRYVECSRCGKKIYEGEKVYNNLTCGIYCSAECYVQDQVPGVETQLDTNLVEDCATEWCEE